MKQRFWPIILIFARLFLGGVFAYAGFMKLTEPAANFQAVLEQYTLIPNALIPILARTIPWIEWLGGMFLIVGYMTRVNAFILALFCLSFIFVLSGSVWSGEGLKMCGCFGGSGIVLTVRQAYFLDWINLGIACLIFFERNRLLTLDTFFIERE